jgi:enoyl-[acyl-carrier protein] reductase II
VIIAQGAEAGGQGMALGVGAMALLPQVADAVDPVPVLAAGGVADGRGLAAALVLGAQGANVGTRYLASEEASTEEVWKRTILRTESEDVVRFEAW